MDIDIVLQESRLPKSPRLRKSEQTDINQYRRRDGQKTSAELDATLPTASFHCNCFILICGKYSFLFAITKSRV